MSIFCTICETEIFEHQTFTQDENGEAIHTRCRGIEDQEIQEVQSKITHLEDKIKLLEKEIQEKS